MEFDCSEEGCSDHTAGFINYFMLYKCTISTSALRAVSTVGLVLWMLVNVYVMQDTTDDYFCVALQHLVSFFKMTPAVAGVTFLAVGNGSVFRCCC